LSASSPPTLEAGGPPSGGPVPWQLRLFSKSLKKRQKVALLSRQIRDLPGTRHLLVTCGDNNGALNHELRKRSGGSWTWMEMEPESIPSMSELLGEPVLHVTAHRLEADDEAFDVTVSLDVQEHLTPEELERYHAELLRVTRRGGHVVATTPNGDPWKPVSILRRALGMTREKYGHTVYGYNVAQHERMLREAGLAPTAAGSYSGFFTELIELLLNFAYTTLLSRGRTGRREGEIAPSSREKLAKVERQYRMYALVYPVLRAISWLDVLAPLGAGYAVSVVARRPAASSGSPPPGAGSTRR
jgi:2-polyprenyl-3-methyl-5-hydroxy-6-metoxy-1,4-benzoquinol methylase